MFATSSRIASENSAPRWKRLCYPVLAITFGASSLWAQAPNVLVDAQQVLGSGFSNPQSIAISTNGTIYVADTTNNQILILTNLLPGTGENSPVSIGSITPALNTPQALTVDAAGDLFIADTPGGGGRILELTGDGAGNLTGTSQVVYAGSILTNPISLAIDSAGTLYIGDYNNTDPNNTVGTVYTIPFGGTTPTALPTGLPTTIIPASLALDSAKDLYIADNNEPGGVYKLKPGGTATTVATGQFVINQPSGVTLDTAGDLFILSLLGSGTGPNAGQQVVIVPATTPTTPYILPNNGIGASSSMAFDPQGNLNVVDSADGEVFQLAYRTPVNMGNVFPSLPQFSADILFNFELNRPETLGAFQVVSQGDVSQELTQVSGGTCTTGSHTTVGGEPITPYVPYTCSETYSGTAGFPGLRYNALQLKGTGTTILASFPVYQTGFAGAEVTYPLNATVTVTGLKQPQALAISGENKKLYIADTGESGQGGQGYVYSTNGPGGTTLSRVNTGREPLIAPSALALDGAGNLFIADFERGDVIEVPTTTGATPSAINTGGLLQHPIALAFDYLGDLYIGDAGPGGVDAGNGNPGFIVEIPVGGSAFKLTIPGVTVVFPQALATDPYTAALFIGDGGDPSGTGQVVQLYVGTATVFPVNNVTNPTGLAFDAAEDLYVLDGNANAITVVAGAQLGNSQTLLPFGTPTTPLSAASALAVSAGAQSFVIANIGNGSSNNLVYLNGNASTLNFGSVTDGSQSQSMTATVNNIGNLDLTLQSPYYTTNATNAAFSVLGSSTCDDGFVLPPYVPCTINMQFTPQGPGGTSQQIFVQSDGYNSGSTTLTAEGTGVGSGNFRRRNTRRDERGNTRNDQRGNTRQDAHGNAR